MVLEFVRKLNMSPGQRDTGDEIDADHINELQEGLEGLSSTTAAIQDGTLPIALAGIEGALGVYEPLQNMRVGAVNVLDGGGVVGDGVTDDTAGITAKLASLATGDTLKFPAGAVYKGSPATRHVLPADCTIDARGATMVDVLFEPWARSRIVGAHFTSAGARTQCAIRSGPDDAPDVSVRDCTFEGFEHGLFVEGHTDTDEQQNVGWSVEGCRFIDNSYGLLLIRGRNFRVVGNRATGCDRSLMFFGGMAHRISGNALDGGVSGISFVYHRSTVSRYSPHIQNIVMGNTVSGFSEEGISFDVRGNEEANIGTIECDVVASTDASGPTNRVTLTADGWSASPAALYFNYWMTFVTGALAGRSYRVAGHSAATARFDFSESVLTDGEHALIAPGDRVIIGVPAQSNSIVGNTVDCSYSSSEAADYAGAGIVNWGNCFRTVISGNTVINGEITLRSLEGLVKPTPTYTDASGKAPVMFCSVIGNTVDHGNIRFGYKGYGAFANNPTYQSLGCVANGNAVTAGALIADGHQVVEAGNVADSFDTANGGGFNP